MSDSFDVIVLGAGMAGSSAAAEIAADRRVALVELEDQPGRHATGRSAAMFFTSYGNAAIRALTRASHPFFLAPPAGFVEAPLLVPRAGLLVADAEHAPRIQSMLDADDAAGVLHRVSIDEACAQVPILRRERIADALVDATSSDIDVAALQQGYLRLARQRGAKVVLDAGEVRIERVGAEWHVDSRRGTLRAPVVVNATGAWADVVGAQVGARTIGLQPLRRSAATIPAPEGHDISRWPALLDAGETFYFKPDAGQLLLSPANEDPSPPCDAAPDELDIAIAVDRFETATSVQVRRVLHRWAGLRSFVADRTLVIGFDPHAEGFFWLAAQGGYGIQTAPAALSPARDGIGAGTSVLAH